MAKVYILNRGPHDYTDAGNFGELIYCTEGILDRFDISGMYTELCDQLINSSSDDYVLLTSLTSLCCIACSIMVSLHGELNLLIHTGSHYVGRHINFHNRMSKEYT